MNNKPILMTTTTVNSLSQTISLDKLVENITKQAGAELGQAQLIS